MELQRPSSSFSRSTCSPTVRAVTKAGMGTKTSTSSVARENWYEYLVVEATAEVQAGPDVLADLRRIYEQIRGEAHPNWDEFDQAMIRDGRVVLALTIERLYPIT